MKAYSLLKSKKDFIFPIANFHHQSSKPLKSEIIKYFISTKKFSKLQTQKLEKSYYDAGQFYLGTKFSWMNNSKILKGVKLPKYSSVDIDDKDDWLYSERLYKLLKNEKKYKLKKVLLDIITSTPPNKKL